MLALSFGISDLPLSAVHSLITKCQQQVIQSTKYMYWVDETLQSFYSYGKHLSRFLYTSHKELLAHGMVSTQEK